MSVVANADIYAAQRINVFFPGVDPSLDGQCVSLVKWFMQEMSGVPNPQAARGDARYVGKTLVAQGFADEIPYDQRRRGDIICMEYGLYGHIYVQLSGNRVFEENVNWPGVSSKIVDGSRVYASRIGNDNESWRHDMYAYRLKSYNEQGDSDMAANENYVNNVYTGVLMRSTPPYNTKTGVWDDPAAKGWVGQPEDVVLQKVLETPERSQVVEKYNSGGGKKYKPAPPMFVEDV